MDIKYKKCLEDYSKIKAIKASVGGHFGGYYDVTINLISFYTTWSFAEGGLEKTSEKSISLTETKDFLEQLRQINLFNWKEEYIENGVCDGTHWCLEIQVDEKIMSKHGVNKFPKEWEPFCVLIEQVTGNKFR